MAGIPVAIPIPALIINTLLELPAPALRVAANPPLGPAPLPAVAPAPPPAPGAHPPAAPAAFSIHDFLQIVRACHNMRAFLTLNDAHQLIHQPGQARGDMAPILGAVEATVNMIFANAPQKGRIQTFCGALEAYYLVAPTGANWAPVYAAFHAIQYTPAQQGAVVQKFAFFALHYFHTQLTGRVQTPFALVHGNDFRAFNNVELMPGNVFGKGTGSHDIAGMDYWPHIIGVVNGYGANPNQLPALEAAQLVLRQKLLRFLVDTATLINVAHP